MTRARDLSRLGNRNTITASSSNNVGIGSTIPDTKLDVVGDVFVTGVVTATSYSGDGSGLTGIDATQIVTGNTSVQTFDTGSDGRVLINTEGLERVRVNSSGQVAIGTATADALLHVYGASTGFIKVETGDGATNPILMHENPDRLWHAGLRGDTNDSYVIRDQTATSNRLEINTSGDILPGADATQDLGATDKRFANIYSADLQLSNEGSSNDVDGTWGKYTIQEGEDDLFLINRRTGKKYKFMLEEVE
jgi:hypothetical protein